MNLLVNANPKPTSKSVGATLAHRLAERLPGGPIEVVRVYDTQQEYFEFQYNEEWVDFVMRAEHIIIPTPMWNLSIPAALKDFIDKIAQQGKLWDIDGEGQFVGLLQDRPVYIIMTSGGHYPPGSGEDFVVPYLKAFFGFIGIKNVRDFRIGGVYNSKKRVNDEADMDELTRQMLAAFALQSDL